MRGTDALSGLFISAGTPPGSSLSTPRKDIEDAYYHPTHWRGDRAGRARRRPARYPANPVATPDQVEVVLGDIPAGGERLTGPDIEVFNCVDRRSCIELPDPSGPLSVHACQLEQVAATGAAGDFLDIVRPKVDADPTDSFAEVQMYHHTTRAYAAFRQLVDDPEFTLESRPLAAIANLRLPAVECIDGAPPRDAELPPLDNAFFAPAGELALFERDVIAFGQGLEIDFSYDGDVVYHELGHALVFALTDLGFARLDELGVDPTTAGLHEGYADYVSSTITGDPLVGEYAGSRLNPEVGAIRRLDNDFTCPEHLTGESHIDSEVWTGALWQIREATAAADRPALDRAVVAALAGLGTDDGFATAAQLTTAEIEVALGPQAAERARGVFRSRGVDGCGERVIDMRVGDRRELLMLGGYGGVPGPHVPSPLQFRVRLERPARALRVGVKNLGPSALSLTLLVKPGDEPIRWSWTEAGGEHDAAASGEVDPDTSIVEVEGDFAAGVHHLQLVSGPEGALLGDVGFAFEAADAEPDAGAAGAIDAGPAGGDRDEGGSCTAWAGRGSSGGAGSTAAALLVVAAIARLRRRRRSTARSRGPSSIGPDQS